MEPLNPTGSIQTSGGTIRVAGVRLFRQNGGTLTFGGLSLATAATYAVLFAVALWGYTTWWSDAPVLQADSRSYMQAAYDLSDYRRDALQIRPPGYPLLLMLTGASTSPSRALLLTSLMLHCMTIWALASVLHRLGASHVTLILFAVLLLLPPYAEAAGYVLTENLVEGALAIGFLGAARWVFDGRTRWLWLSGVAIGCAALTHPTYQLLAIAIAGCLAVGACFGWPGLHWKSVSRGSVLLVGVSLLMVGGYAFANYQRFGHFVVGHKLGLVLSTKTFAFVERLPEEYAPVRAALMRARADAVAAGGWHDAGDSIHLALPELTRITGLQEPELSDYLLKLNLTLMTIAPLSYAHEVATAFAVHWMPASGPLANSDSEPLQLAWSVLHFSVMTAFAFTFVVVSGAGLLTFLSAGSERRQIRRFVGPDHFHQVEILICVVALACTIVFYTAAVSSLFEIGLPRYRVPTDALILFSVFVGAELLRRMRDMLTAFPSAR